LPYIAQNGIQFSRGATGHVASNTVSATPTRRPTATLTTMALRSLQEQYQLAIDPGRFLLSCLSESLIDVPFPGAGDPCEGHNVD
jgi:hypothetical protein